MDLNSILFPAPKPSYTIESLKEQLIWIPKYKPSSASFENRPQKIFKHRSNVSMSYNTPMLKHKSSISVTNPRHKLESKTIENEDSGLNSNSSILYKQQIIEPKNTNRISIQGQQTSKKINKKNVPSLKLDLFCKDTDNAHFQTKPEEETDLFEITERTLSSTRGDRAHIPKITIKPIPTKQLKTKVSLLIPLHTLCTSNTEACNISQSNFDSNHTDEYDDTQIQSSPRTFFKYETLMLSNPISGTRSTSKNNYQKETLSNFSKSNGTRICNSVSSIQKTQCLSARLELRAPKITSSATFSLQNTKKNVTSEAVINYIPCLLLKPECVSDKILIYFHGNGEDINLSYDLLSHVRDNLYINVLAVEYPGYGLYKGFPNDTTIMHDSEAVYEFLITKLKVKPKNIISFGRSIGSGPATYLASKREVGALILMSAFTSIRGVAKDFAGRLVQYLIKERFNNLEAITRVKCPTFLVHGQKDRLIPFNHSEELHRACGGASELVLPKEMNHIEFDFDKDFTDPLIGFLERSGILSNEVPISSSSNIYFPNTLFLPPQGILEQQANRIKDQPRRRERHLFAKSYDTNILQDNELMNLKSNKRSILDF